MSNVFILVALDTTSSLANLQTGDNTAVIYMISDQGYAVNGQGTKDITVAAGIGSQITFNIVTVNPGNESEILIPQSFLVIEQGADVLNMDTTRITTWTGSCIGHGVVKIYGRFFLAQGGPTGAAFNLTINVVG